MFKKAIHYFLTLVKTLDDLPADVSTAIKRLDLEHPIQAIIVVPPQEYPIFRLGRVPFGWRATPERTLVFTDCEIVIVEVIRSGGLNTIVIPLEALVGIDLAVVLLYAYVQLTWIQGEHIETLKIEFNAVGEQTLRKQLDRVRLVTSQSHPPIVPDHKSDVNLPSLPFKFQSYIKYSLLPGEQVLAAIYQPALRRAQGWPRSFISPNRSIAITDRHLLILEEDEGKPTPNYGIVTRFCPLHHLQNLVFETDENAIWLRLVLGTDVAQTTIRIPLESHHVVELRDLGEAVVRQYS